MSKSTQNIEPEIHTIRGLQVVLDADLARAYGVPMFQLRDYEAQNLKCQTGTSSLQRLPEEYKEFRRAYFRQQGCIRKKTRHTF